MVEKERKWKEDEEEMAKKASIYARDLAHFKERKQYYKSKYRKAQTTAGLERDRRKREKEQKAKEKKERREQKEREKEQRRKEKEERKQKGASSSSAADGKKQVA